MERVSDMLQMSKWVSVARVHTTDIRRSPFVGHGVNSVGTYKVVSRSQRIAKYYFLL